MYVCIPSFFFSLSVIDATLSYRGFVFRHLVVKNVLIFRVSVSLFLLPSLLHTQLFSHHHLHLHHHNHRVIMSSDKSPSSSTYHPSDLPSSFSDTIPTDYDEEQQQSQPPSTDDEPPIPPPTTTTTTNSTTIPSSIDHKFHLFENRLSGFAESLSGIATCLDSLQQQITSLSSSSLSSSSSSTFLQKEKYDDDDDDDENSRSEEEKREAVVDGQEREEQIGVMMGEEKEEEVGGKESNEDEAEDTAEQRPEGGGDGKVNNEGFLGEVISGILNGDDGEVES